MDYIFRTTVGVALAIVLVLLPLGLLAGYACAGAAGTVAAAASAGVAQPQIVKRVVFVEPTEIEPQAGDSLVEKHVRVELSSVTPWRVGTGLGEVRSWACGLEVGEADQVLYRGGPDVDEATGVQYCDACELGDVPNGDSAAAYLLAETGDAGVRCVVGVSP